MATNLAPLGFGANSENFVWGAARNPLDGKRTVGSSAGAALSLTRCVPFGITTDFAGDSKLSAHFCGCLGFRPTPQRIDHSGNFGQVRAMSSLGPVSKHFSDLKEVVKLQIEMKAFKCWKDLEERKFKIGYVEA